jgi:nitrite reductase/ring-hydroxylating ferredoxin subunit
MKFICLALSALIFVSCKKSKEQPAGGYVDVYLYASDPGFFPLQVTGGWMYYPANNNSGLKGLVIYRNSPEKFSAFDRACPYHTGDPCALIEVEADNVSAVDSCCGSRFLIIDGQIINGPATSPLISYRTTFNGSVLHIFN